MAVRQDTRQKLLFANDDFPTIEYGRVCTRCKEFKSSSEFYTVKRKKGEGRRLGSLCKSCDNERRQLTIERARGPDWVDGNVKRRNERRAKSLETKAEKRRRRREEKDAQKNEFGEWTNVIRGALSDAINDQKQYVKSGWDRKCHTVIKGLRKRHKIGAGKGLQKCTTWSTRCKAAKANLKAVMKRPHMDAWKKKCSTCALNHKRKHKERSKRTANCDL